MKPAGDLRSYREDPVGRWLAGRTWTHFTSERGISGLVLWGRPDVEDVSRMTAAMTTELPGGSPRHAAFDDARRLEHADVSAFEAFARFIAEHNERFAANVSCQAVIRPHGVVGAVVAGFFDIVKPIGDGTRVFTDAREAMRFVGGDDALLAEVDAIYEAAAGLPPIVRAVRDVLVARRGRASVREVARAVGLSTRTLQDHLREAGTSLRAETNEARVRTARVLLQESDASLAKIALEVGCASQQHFSTLFRKLEGVTPSAYRAARRA